MPKAKSNYVCQACGYVSPKWMGKCPGCGQWNTMVEEIYTAPQPNKGISDEKPLALNSIAIVDDERYASGIKELDRVLGGGIVKASLVLVGGDPGIGKSTLLMQMAGHAATSGLKVLYVSGEESPQQIKLRSLRLGITDPGLLIYAQTDLDVIEQQAHSIMPDIMIVDSIQTVYDPELSSAPGSVSQVREATARLMRLAKGTGITVFIVGHVTKEGAIAGPRVLEHMVDTVLYFEGERHQAYRVLRAVKNRFGSTNEIGVFEMHDAGLREVSNPSEVMLSDHQQNATGSAVVCSMEGTRPVLVEIQALISPTAFGMPRRMATGIDYNRVVMLMAVLEKRAGLMLQNQDAYVNVAGGLKLDEPAADLGIIMAIASSFREKPVNGLMVFIGEVGLTGEIRAVSRLDQRLNECARMGFTHCMVPAANSKDLRKYGTLSVIPVRTVYESLDMGLL
ncbi:DNA repair protein RadA [Mahella australiensis]|uniref:DNA repair protein RadA n=1 Tax=Mahella australiensis (strain DSM 15567 / CIP 107919 / 50-1 BON) TaxID=697281 RepID=F3ZYR0_MAHA5|nr:DNA repair protein RadA [Mahella australiensis]AEE95655.1 DNA repair protein RadA [Mahella australiensis 50-1 BON]